MADDAPQLLMTLGMVHLFMPCMHLGIGGEKEGGDESSWAPVQKVMRAARRQARRIRVSRWQTRAKTESFPFPFSKLESSHFIY